MQICVKHSNDLFVAFVDKYVDCFQTIISLPSKQTIILKNNMIKTHQLCLVFLLTFIFLTKADDQAEIDYYVNLINNRSAEALKYEFAPDARMYDAADKTLHGTVFCLFLSILL